MNLRSVAALGIAGVLLFGTACGGDDGNDSVDSASDNDTRETTAAAADSGSDNGGGDVDCDIVAKADVDAAFGITFNEVEDTSQAGATMCNYASQEPISSITYVIKESSASEWAPTLEATRKSGATVKETSGVGDKTAIARLDKYGQTTIQVYATKGDAFFFTTAAVFEHDVAKVESASIEVAKKIADRL